MIVRILQGSPIIADCLLQYDIAVDHRVIPPRLCSAKPNPGDRVAVVGIRPEGRMMGLGTAPLPLPVKALIMKRASIIGSQHNDRRHLHNALALAARGRVKPMIETYSLAEAEKARKRLASRRTRFRAVIVM